MRKSIFVLVVLLLLAGISFPSGKSSASADLCTPCRTKCQDEGMQKQYECLGTPTPYEQCKAEYFQYVSNCTAVFCNYGGLCLLD